MKTFDTSRRNFLTSLAAAPFALEASNLWAQNAADSASNSSDSTSAVNAETTPFVFRDGRFKILQLTDLHLGFQNADSIKKAETTLDVVRKLLAEEKPDLAILTGDVVTTNPDALPGGVVEAWSRVAQPFEEAKIPFAANLGNHDHERQESAKELLAAMRKSPWNKTFDADPELPGAGNCFFSIVDADGKERRRLWLFDSHSYPFQGDLGSYDWIKSTQIEWYRRESEKAERTAGAPVPSLAFFHIPLPEYWKVHQTAERVGVANEDVCSPELNSGLFTAFVERGDVEGVFVGHDHVNDYVGVYKNVALVYGRKTGLDTYGDLPLGGRIIEVTEDAGFTTSDVVPGAGRSTEFTFKKG